MLMAIPRGHRRCAATKADECRNTQIRSRLAMCKAQKPLFFSESHQHSPMSHCGRVRVAHGAAEPTIYTIGMVVPNHQANVITIHMRPSIRRRAISLRSSSDLTTSAVDADGSVCCSIILSGSAGKLIQQLLAVQFFGKFEEQINRRRVQYQQHRSEALTGQATSPMLCARLTQVRWAYAVSP
jgi:hypothetical protein